jgi:hypothetical protein
MQPHEHRAAAARIERSIAKLLPADHELLIEAAMLAGSHWLNARLHETGLRNDRDDVMHTYLLTVNECRRLAVAEPDAIAALVAIEDMRPGFVRGDQPGGAEAGHAALRLLGKIRARALHITP